MLVIIDVTDLEAVSRRLYIEYKDRTIVGADYDETIVWRNGELGLECSCRAR